MTDYCFTINGVDFRSLVNKHHYETDRVPVVAWKITDLDGVDHQVVQRWRGKLKVGLNDLTADESSAICAALMETPLSIRYHSFQLGADTTEEMRITSMPVAHLLKSAGQNWHAGVTLSFEQL